MQVHTQWHNLNYNHSLINTSTLVWCEKLYTFSLISPEVRLDQAVVGNIPLKSIFHNHLYLIKPQETRQAELRWQWVMSLYLEHCFHISHSTHKVSRVNMRLIRSAVLLSYMSWDLRLMWQQDCEMLRHLSYESETVRHKMPDALMILRNIYILVITQPRLTGDHQKLSWVGSAADQGLETCHRWVTR